MRKGIVAITLCAAGLAIAAGDARADQAQASAQAQGDQARIAAATLKLEKAFDQQFLQGKIDRNAISGEINEVVQAMPEAERSGAQSHIEHVLQAGERLVSRMSPEQRADVAAPVENVGKAQQAWISSWGWPGAMGWGGYGAFGWPGYGTYGLGGYGLGYGLGYGVGYGGMGWGWY